MIDGINALSATKSSAESFGADGSTGVGTASNSSGADFGQMLSQVVNDAIGTVQSGEAAAIQGLQGTVPAFKVVESVMAAQRTLQSALAIRDKAVSAYQEISHMSI
jgi:flagellar hook-basal body complex protein FliE